MSKLKPLGSEKLTGQDKINRIMEIARFNETLPNPVNEFSKSEYSVDLADNHNYQIVKERQGYIIKRTISESETDYIEPMKNRKYYSSYSQAFKRLNLLAKELNRLNENDEGISLFGEQKKFVLKTPKSAAPSMDTPPPAAPPAAPPPVPSPELPDSPLSGTEGPEAALDMASPETDAALDSMAPEGGEDMGMDMGMETPSSMGKEEETVTFRTIQKLTGKLTQKLRVLDSDKGMTSEDIKYVINMVLSALDLSKISDEDREDIMSKFEESETEEMPGMGEELPSDDVTSDTEVEDIQTDMDVPVEGEMGENKRIGKIFDGIFAESKVDKVISKYFIQTKKEILENNKKNIEKNFERLRNVNRQMQEVLKLAESVEQEMATRKFLEENKSSNFVGKTNKKNLVLEMNGVQVKISPKGFVKNLNEADSLMKNILNLGSDNSKAEDIIKWLNSEARSQQIRATKDLSGNISVEFNIPDMGRISMTHWEEGNWFKPSNDSEREKLEVFVDGKKLDLGLLKATKIWRAAMNVKKQGLKK